jgi:hypothetical protein
VLDALVDAELDAGGELDEDGDADWLGALLGLEDVLDELDDGEGEGDGDGEVDGDGEGLGEGELAAGSG